jgi:hypothetical protein
MCYNNSERNRDGCARSAPRNRIQSSLFLQERATFLYMSGDITSTNALRRYIIAVYHSSEQCINEYTIPQTPPPFPRG